MNAPANEFGEVAATLTENTNRLLREYPPKATALAPHLKNTTQSNRPRAADEPGRRGEAGRRRKSSAHKFTFTHIVGRVGKEFVIFCLSGAAPGRDLPRGDPTIWIRALVTRRQQTMADSTMRWVEWRSYAGLDRRRTARSRLIERRKVDLSEPLPPVHALLRQLHIRLFDLEMTADAAPQFRFRLQVAAGAAQTSGQSDIAVFLRQADGVLARCGQRSIAAQDREAVGALVKQALGALR